MADTTLLDSAPTFIPTEHSSQGMQVLSNDPNAKEPFQNGTASTTNGIHALPPKSSMSDQVFKENWDSAYRTRFAPGHKHPFPMPHETTKFPVGPAPLLMSWWPTPEKPSDYFNTTEKQEVTTHPTTVKKAESLLAKLEHRLGALIWGVGENGSAKATNGAASTPATTKPAVRARSAADNLYHVILTSTHPKKDVNSYVQGVRICGTYSALSPAKALAHRCLFDAGYQQEWFTKFRTQHEGELIDHKQSEIVDAVGPDGEEFVVSISTIPNVFHLKSNASHRVVGEMYHVVQTVVHYNTDESGQTRDTTIQGSFKSYEQARKVAQNTLLWWEDNIDRDTYAEYDEAGPGELDCGYGENVIVHAVGQNGDNFLVSVLKGQEMESERVMEAAAEMRG